MARMLAPQPYADRPWNPTKFVLGKDGTLQASRDPQEVWVASRLIADRIADFYAEALPLHASGSLLDLGCGKAPLLGTYRDRTESATLVDWGNSLHENPHLDAIADLNEPLALESERYDTVLLSDVLEHIKRPNDLMAEIARVLAPGGTLIMNTPFLYGLHERPHDYYRYTEYALADIVESAGLELVEVRPIGGAVEVLVDIASKVACSVPVVGSRLATVLQAVGAWLCRRLPRGLASRGTTTGFPSGYGLVARKTPSPGAGNGV